MAENNLDFDSIMLNYTTKVFEECEKKDQITASIDDGYRMSTSLLALDMIMNGGIRSGWVTSLGLEASGKSSLAIKMMGSLAKQHIPSYFIDAEGALDTEYACAIAGINDITEYFGRKSPTGKGYEVPPKIRYTDENILEKVFRFIKRILLNLPDKVFRQDTGKWYLKFTRDKSDMEMMKALGLKHDTKLYTQTGQYWCEVPHGKFQAAFIIDSLPALVTSEVGEESDKESKAIALDARAFAKEVKPVRGLLRRKHAVVLAVNQLRDNPGVVYGPSTYEPCGNAVKFCSDVRNQLTTRSVKEGWQKAKVDGYESSAIGAEASAEVEGAEDRYVYKHIKNIKNKRGIPFRSGWVRLWISDYNGKARGFDPVFDCFSYLEMTRQATLKRVAGRRELTGLESVIPGLQAPIVDWLDFKRLIIGEYFNKPELVKAFMEKFNLTEEPNVMNKCFKQVETGEAFDKLIDIKEPVNNSNEDEFVELDEETNLESDFDADDISEDLD